MELKGREWVQEMSLSGAMPYSSQFLSSCERQGVKFVVQIRDFAGLRWELCLFHSVLLLPSATMSSSSKGQNKLHFHLIFFLHFLKNRTSDRKKWHCILVRLSYFPLHSPHCGLLKLLQERCDITFINSSRWLSQL